MKAVVIRGREVHVLDVPAPRAGPRSILVRVEHSCISAGTELAGIRFAAEPLYRRALRQPEKVRRALQMVRHHGLRYTMDRARGTSSNVRLGYSAAGTVIEVGDDVEWFAPGERVACAGAGIASHAELIDVPVNLAVKVPQAVPTDAAATVALGAIALQGVRRTAPSLGETIMVVGLGLIGQITVQLLRANGCRVIGTDLDGERVAMARKGGLNHEVESSANGFSQAVRNFTDGHGADAVIVTAATPSHDLINHAMIACRRKGRVVLVGDVGLNLRRDALYARELDFLVSTSYGPGRYDADYEEAGVDYPLPYVRWTENRNMATYLELLADGRVSLAPLSRRSWPVGDAASAYASLGGEGAKPLLALLDYPPRELGRAERRISLASRATPSGAISVGVIGAGNFAQTVHLPNMRRARSGFALRAVAGRNGVTAHTIAKQYDAAYATTDVDELLGDPAIEAVLIATRHHLHAPLALAALAAGKHVFVEKPLAISEEQLTRIESFYVERDEAPLLMTGFNRRFSPAIAMAKSLLAARRSPLVVNYRMNAGPMPPEHWVHGEEGGGRNVGEACHIYDLFNFLTGARFVSVQAEAIAASSPQWRRNENFVATVRYADGSICTLTYTALGTPDYPKEQMEIFVDGTVLALDDYRALIVSGRREGGWQSRRAEKGHTEELDAFSAGIREGRWPIPLEEQVAATRISFLVERALHAPTDSA